MQYGHVEQAKSVKMKFDQMQAHISQGVQDAINSPAHSLIQVYLSNLNHSNVDICSEIIVANHYRLL